MRTKRGYISLLIVVLACSMVLASCEAITAQKITDSDSGSRMNGFPGRNGGMNFNGGGRGMDGGGPGMNGRTQRNGGQGQGQGTDGGTSGRR
ncbi:hypothetical protein [Paenibacillus sp. HW567]|uniref:hypothetical protein n=1 Tax=Paenibacillus sp. HW567 TaxID=1034769 RepID=UPI00036C6A26|nr:hypothetical protein [Paenibacillus sp. HW567]